MYFSRKIEYHLLGIFLQQTILIVVGFLTFLFEVTTLKARLMLTTLQVTNFQDRVMVSLTLMLVIATISTSIQQVDTVKRELPSSKIYSRVWAAQETIK